MTRRELDILKAIHETGPGCLEVHWLQRLFRTRGTNVYAPVSCSRYMQSAKKLQERGYLQITRLHEGIARYSLTLQGIAALEIVPLAKLGGDVFSNT